jgi:hypothetical protein
LLRSKSPSLARKELWVHLIAYNLVRTVNNLCANKYRKEEPHKQSFKLSLKLYLYSLISLISFEVHEDKLEILKDEILKTKYRREPRAIRKRSSRYPLLTTSRKLAKNEKWGYSRRRGRLGLSSCEAA